MIDVLPELTHADHVWPRLEKRGFERELFDALARPWVKNTSTRAIDALLNAGIHTRAEIVKRGVHDMLMVKNLGPTLLAFIRQRLNEAEMTTQITELDEYVIVPPLTDEQVERAAEAIVRWEHEHREMLDGIRPDEPIDRFKQRVDDRYRGQARAALKAVLVPKSSPAAEA